MGRSNTLPKDTKAPVRLRIEMLDMIDGDYDKWGAYWGGVQGLQMYCIWNRDTYIFRRAKSGFEAIMDTMKILPNADISWGYQPRVCNS